MINNRVFKVKLWDEVLSRMYIVTIPALSEEDALIKIESENKDAYLIEIEEIYE